MKGEEKVLEFADELTEEQMFAVNGGGRFSSSSSSGSSSSGRSSNSSRGGSRSSGSGNSKKSSGSSIGSRIGSAVSSIGSKISNAFSGNKSGGSANTSDKKAESSYVPYKGLPGYTPPTRTDGAESKKSSVQAGGTATAAPAVTRTTNGSADNPPSAMSGSPSTYLTRQPESVSPAVTGSQAVRQHTCRSNLWYQDLEINTAVALHPFHRLAAVPRQLARRRILQFIAMSELLHSKQGQK